MKHVFCLFVVLLLGCVQLVSGQQVGAGSVVGTWLSEDKDGKIEVYQAGGKIEGKLVWGKHIVDTQGNPEKDTKNPDEKLRNRNLMNLVILTGFVYKDGEWSGGKIYDPKSGKTYSAVMKLKGKMLELRGYVGISLFGRSTVWTRVE